MKTSKQGIEMIKNFEGCRLTPYYCPSGVLTVGYGHTGKDVKVGKKITLKQAEKLLKSDLKKFEKHVSSFKSYKWNQNEFDAMVSFAYNIGSINQLTNNGKRTKIVIAEKMLLYVNSNGKPLNGLILRRKKEHDLFVKGLWKNVSKKNK